MKRFLKIAGIILVTVLALFFIASLYLYYMPDRNLAKEEANFAIESSRLFAEYEQNPTKSDQKYMDNVIDVKGTIAEISTDQKGATVMVLREATAFAGVLCTLREDQAKAIKNYKVGDSIQIRGVCTGMLMDVVLNKCVVL